jgi:transposase
MKTVLPKFTTLEGLVSVLQAPLSPSVLFITEETMVFTDWVEKVLKESGIPPRKRYYRKSNKAWEIKAQEGLQNPIL